MAIVAKKRCKRNYGTWKDNPLYERWREIRRRCMAPSNKSWKHYGGRGIRVCEEWDSFPDFEQWAMENGYEPGLHIDRIDVNRDYSPDNCRWVTNLQNQNNKRNNFYVSAFGETKTLAEWGRDERCVVSYNTLCQRLNQNHPTHWSPEQAISTPSIQQRRVMT